MELNKQIYPIVCGLALAALSIPAEGASGNASATESVAHYHQAAESGNAEAMYRLALIYREGKGVASDYEEYNKWLHKAAESGYAEAQFRLAVRYLFWGADGQTPEQEAQEYWRLSVEWFRKAAEQGHAEAQCNMGVRYLCGQGVAESATEAASWFRKAAEQGNARAQVFLGGLYEEGEGVPQSFTEAETWYRRAESLYSKAAAQGNIDAKADLIRVRKKVSLVKERAAEKPPVEDGDISIDIEL